MNSNFAVAQPPKPHKIVVIGGSGLIGSKLVRNLRQLGHEVLADSPSSDVNTITGEGLAAALAGAPIRPTRTRFSARRVLPIGCANPHQGNSPTQNLKLNRPLSLPSYTTMKIPHRISFIILALALAGISAAADDSPVKITELLRRDHPELADKEIVVRRIELGPGASSPPHVHPGMVTGYVETGTLEFQLKGGPLLKLKAGDTFFEPPGSHHMVARNTDSAAKVVIIVFVVNPKGAPLSTPIEKQAP